MRTKNKEEKIKKKKAGRPPTPIDWSQFEQLCALQCIQTEIASVLHVDQETLCNRAKEHYKVDNYSDIYKRFSETGKCSLRRNQFVISKKNASMAIWLGKVWLGQKDPCQDEAKEDILHVLKAAIREIQREPRIDSPEQSSLEDKQSLLDQKHRGKETEILSQLGSREALEGNACV